MNAERLWDGELLIADKSVWDPTTDTSTGLPKC